MKKRVSQQTEGRSGRCDGRALTIVDRDPQQVTARGFILKTLTETGGGFSLRAVAAAIADRDPQQVSKRLPRTPGAR
jgi:hypothetical protein